MSQPEPAATASVSKEKVLQAFQTNWKTDLTLLGGEWINDQSSGVTQWYAKNGDDRKILVSALEVLEHFYTNYGGIWTGCFKFENSPQLRGALAG